MCFVYIVYIVYKSQLMHPIICSDNARNTNPYTVPMLMHCSATLFTPSLLLCALCAWFTLDLSVLVGMMSSLHVIPSAFTLWRGYHVRSLLRVLVCRPSDLCLVPFYPFFGMVVVGIVFLQF
eukprot:700813_1